MKEAKIKEIEDSQISVLRIIGEQQMLDGSIQRMARWELLTKPLELGSLRNPLNTDVLNVRIDSREPFKGINLGSFFGGGLR